MKTKRQQNTIDWSTAFKGEGPGGPDPIHPGFTPCQGHGFWYWLLCVLNSIAGSSSGGISYGGSLGGNFGIGGHVGIKVAVISSGDDEGSGGGSGTNPPGWEPPKDNGDGHTDGNDIHPPDTVRTTLEDDGDGNTLCKLCPSSFSIRYKVNYLKTHLGFNQIQNDWLFKHSDYLDQLYDLLEDETEWDEETIATAMINLEVARLDLVDNWDELVFKQILDTYLPIEWKVYKDVIVPYIKMQYAFEAKKDPILLTTSLGKVILFYRAMQEMWHIGLDLAGLVPVIGEIADLTNSSFYLLQGDWLNSGLSAASAIPIAGWYVQGIKWAKKTIIAVDGTKRTLNWIVKANGIISFGDRNLLRKVLGLQVSDSRIAHHLIPWEFEAEQMVQKAAHGNDAFHLNEFLNGVPVTAIQHNNGGHALYNSKVKAKLLDLWNSNGQSAMKSETAAALLRNLSNDIRAWVLAHSNESINNIIL